MFLSRSSTSVSFVKLSHLSTQNAILSLLRTILLLPNAETTTFLKTSWNRFNNLKRKKTKSYDDILESAYNTTKEFEKQLCESGGSGRATTTTTRFTQSCFKNCFKFIYK